MGIDGEGGRPQLPDGSTLYYGNELLTDDERRQRVDEPAKTTRMLLSCFFLWHRRKSPYKEELTAGDRLMPEAENLGSRILHAWNSRDTVGEISEFVNYVIPGTGEPFARLSNVPDQPDKKLVEVFFRQPNGTTRELSKLGGGVEQCLVLALLMLTEPDGGLVFSV